MKVYPRISAIRRHTGHSLKLKLTNSRDDWNTRLLRMQAIQQQRSITFWVSMDITRLVGKRRELRERMHLQ